MSILNWGSDEVQAAFVGGVISLIPTGLWAFLRRRSRCDEICLRMVLAMKEFPRAIDPQATETARLEAKLKIEAMVREAEEYLIGKVGKSHAGEN
jgi:hypothetical protein